VKEECCLHQVHSCSMCKQAAPPELIMLDCYDGEGTIPADLSGVQTTSLRHALPGAYSKTTLIWLHIPDAGPTFLRACIRVLKPGGLLLANLFNNNPGSQARLRFAHYAMHVSRLSHD
jgi:hypothetical protein